MPSAPTTVSAHVGNSQNVFAVPEKPATADEKDISTLHDSAEQKPDVARSSRRQLAFSLPPSTPATKIPLAALTRNLEDDFGHTPTQRTPQEHVEWDHVPNYRPKRSRDDSSPPSVAAKRYKSSHEELTSTGPDSSPNDVSESLMRRYVKSNRKTTHDEPSLPPHIDLFTASPNNPNYLRKSPLRKSVSCTNQWPSSSPKEKQARFGASHLDSITKFEGLKLKILNHAVPRESRVESLLDKMMEEGISRVSLEVDSPSDSSPLPHRTENLAQSQPIPQVAEHEKETPTHIASDDEALMRDEDASSEYDDPFLDEEILEFAIRSQTMLKTAATKESEVGATSAKRNRSKSLQENAVTSWEVHNSSRNDGDNTASAEHLKAKTPLHSDDEFGDFDDELEDAMKELEAKLDSQNQTSFDTSLPPLVNDSNDNEGNTGGDDNVITHNGMVVSAVASQVRMWH